jgi:glycyl-tRNA synthetase beta chain
MKKHQKYFPAYQHKKAVINNFFAIADNVTPQNEKSILQGYEAVLLARLEDVKFFWEEDQKTTLDQLLPRLKKVTFQKNLGSMYEKTERIVKLAEWLVTSFGRRGQGRGPEVDKDPILRTARVCKADLVTHTVYELPSLQGKVGYWLAEVSQDSHNVAQGILEHYNGAANPPNRFEGFFVGIADKMDTIVACFINDLIPTSSRDPWAVRQMAGTILSWIIAMNFDINLIAFVDETYRLFDLGIKNRPELLEFLKTRWKGVLTDKGLEYDIVEAVLESSLEAPLESLKKAADSKKFRSEKPDAFKLLVDTAVRTGRLAKNAKSDNVDEKLFAQVEEKTAWVALKESQESLESVAELSAPMTAYFDKVMVMDKDEKIKTNRLAFLARVDALYRRFGDFEKIVV